MNLLSIPISLQHWAQQGIWEAHSLSCMVHSCSLMTHLLCGFEHHSEMCPHGLSGSCVKMLGVAVCGDRHEGTMGRYAGLATGSFHLRQRIREVQKLDSFEEQTFFYLHSSWHMLCTVQTQTINKHKSQTSKLSLEYARLIKPSHYTALKCKACRQLCVKEIISQKCHRNWNCPP